MTRYMSLSLAHIKRTASRFTSWYLIFCALFLFLRCAAMIYDRMLHGRLPAWWDVWLAGIAKDMIFLMTLGAWAFLGHLLLSLFSQKLAQRISIITAILFCLLHIILTQYFLTTLTMLGSDLWYYSGQDIWQTVSAANIRALAAIGLLAMIILVVWSLTKLPRSIHPAPALGISIIVLSGLAEIFNLAYRSQNWRSESSEYGNSLSNNTSYYFYQQSLDHFFPSAAEMNTYADSNMLNERDELNSSIDYFNYTDEARYPFLHSDETKDVLSPFLRRNGTKPNIVIILLEGVGRAYSNDGAYLGSFTPFMDSLSKHSLYWENFLSSAGRTFAVLPSTLASVPFGKTGFTEMGDRMPPHLSLLSLLKYNGYKTSFYYGGDAQFDNMAGFLQRNAIGHIYDMQSFPGSYSKLPANPLGLCWGYGDKELYRFYFSTLHEEDTPYCRVLLTVTSHEPFLVPEQEKYLDRFEHRMNELRLDKASKEIARDFKLKYASILFADDALRDFFRYYARRPDYHNTIFVVTGDHRMPEIPMNDKLDRYRVPFLIYSPLLQRSAKFASVSSHFDVTPSLLRLLQTQYQLQLPSLVSWVGSGLDTGYTFRNRKAYPFMQSKRFMIDFIQGEHMIVGNDLFSVDAQMRLTPVVDRYKMGQLQRRFEKFKRKNRQITAGARLLPDSVYQRYFPR
ncbi:sulfatase-like hydrolase/transferase [uncultured Chitinophaga sp.]|uniref:LTA synthase family protein n=1 Tax=uncultured Chitinophaga sp. TaxID=339340 RepID=UPI00260F43B0|nr:sulfatase-like hydrolase/transferase [uncultured Chitinophaga sp.]